MVKVIQLQGKSKAVFRFIELMAKDHPTKTLAELK